MHFKLQKASSLDMTFGDFYKIYEQDVKPNENAENSIKSRLWTNESPER